MTNQRSWFKTYQPINRTKDQPIEGISGVKMKAKRIGDIPVQVKNSDNYEMSVLTNVFTCAKSWQKPILIL
jgi:hypothetical protein